MWTVRSRLGARYFWATRYSVNLATAGMSAKDAAALQAYLESERANHRWPSVITDAGGGAPDVAGLSQLSAAALGFPAPCVRAVVAHPDSASNPNAPAYVHREGIDLERVFPSWYEGGHTAGLLHTLWPGRVLWGGLALNVACWLAPAAVLVSLPSVRRVARWRRGRCVRCGYEGGGVCPECGEPRPATWAQAW